MEEVEDPFANYQNIRLDGNPDLTFAQRLEALRKLGKTANEEFKQKYANVNSWFVDYDQAYILSYCLMYFLMHKEGYDEEAVKGSYSFAPHYLEILQALSLSSERNFSAKPLMHEVDKLRADMKEIGTLMQTRLFDMPQNIVTEKELNAYRVRMGIKSHSIAVRNWAYFHQMEAVTQMMAGRVREEFMKHYGLCPVELIKLFFAMVDMVMKRVNHRIKNFRKVFAHKDYIKLQEEYHLLFMKNNNPGLEEMVKMWELSKKDMQALRSALLEHSNLSLYGIFSFSLDDMVLLSGNTIDKNALLKIMDALSYEFGDLKEHNKEFVILDNPTHTRPFIKLDPGVYFTSMWQALPHLSITLLEHLVEQEASLKEKYSSERAKFLEDEVEVLFKKSFPNAKVYRGSKWTDATGKQYENDLLVVIDTFALVVEAKSGLVTPSAKRGAPDRLFRTIKDLIEEPSEQALRFIEYLKENRRELTFPCKAGNNQVDARNLNYFIPLGVTFYRLASVGANLKPLIDGGIINKQIHELAPSISLSDLEIVFDILPTEAQKIHYLQRRRELEMQVDYFGDELDLLGFYLDTGFDTGDIEGKGRTALNLVIKSKDLDPYIIGTTSGKTVPKPELKMTTWWKDLLKTIDKRKPERWLEFSYVLLNINIGNQQHFEKGYKELLGKIVKKEVELEHNWVTYRTANPLRQFAVAAYPYETKYKDERNGIFSEIIAQALDDNPNLKGMVIIGINTDKGHYPYSCLAGDLSVTLFDDHFKTMSTVRTGKKHGG